MLPKTENTRNSDDKENIAPSTKKKRTKEMDFQSDLKYKTPIQTHISKTREFIYTIEFYEIDDYDIEEYLNRQRQNNISSSSLYGIDQYGDKYQKQQEDYELQELERIANYSDSEFELKFDPENLEDVKQEMDKFDYNLDLQLSSDVTEQVEHGKGPNEARNFTPDVIQNGNQTIEFIKTNSNYYVPTKTIIEIIPIIYKPRYLYITLVELLSRNLSGYDLLVHCVLCQFASQFFEKVHILTSVNKDVINCFNEKMSNNEPFYYAKFAYTDTMYVFKQVSNEILLKIHDCNCPMATPYTVHIFLCNMLTVMDKFIPFFSFLDMCVTLVMIVNCTDLNKFPALNYLSKYASLLIKNPQKVLHLDLLRIQKKIKRSKMFSREQKIVISNHINTYDQYYKPPTKFLSALMPFDIHFVDTDEEKECTPKGRQSRRYGPKYGCRERRGEENARSHSENDSQENQVTVSYNTDVTAYDDTETSTTQAFLDLSDASNNIEKNFNNNIKDNMVMDLSVERLLDLPQSCSPPKSVVNHQNPLQTQGTTNCDIGNKLPVNTVLKQEKQPSLTDSVKLNINTELQLQFNSIDNGNQIQNAASNQHVLIQNQCESKKNLNELQNMKRNNLNWEETYNTKPIFKMQSHPSRQHFQNPVQSQIPPQPRMRKRSPKHSRIPPPKYPFYQSVPYPQMHQFLQMPQILSMPPQLQMSSHHLINRNFQLPPSRPMFYACNELYPNARIHSQLPQNFQTQPGSTVHPQTNQLWPNLQPFWQHFPDNRI